MGQSNAPQHTTPTTERPETLAEQKIAPGLRGRESHCTHNCGKGENGCGDCGASCGTGGVEGVQIIQLIPNQFNYNDSRRIIEVEFRGARREFIEVQDETPLKVRDLVVVQTERGLDAGFVSMTGSLVHVKRKAKKLSGAPLPTMVRKGDASDLERHTSNRKQEKEALALCRARVEFFRLPMELVDAEWQFDHHRITFFFLADGRVDFRELVRDLAANFHTRIELRQIPARDEAKRLGTVGICGLQLCCTTHLGRYEHITLDHARAQHIQPNPTKLSGQCGRLKCCLLYEVDHYVEALKRFPPIEATVRTHKGEGVLHKIDIFRDQLVIHHPDGWETITLADFIEQQKTPPPPPAPPPTPANARNEKQEKKERREQKPNDQKPHGGKPRGKEERSKEERSEERPQQQQPPNKQRTPPPQQRPVQQKQPGQNEQRAANQRPNNQQQQRPAQQPQRQHQREGQKGQQNSGGQAQAQKGERGNREESQRVPQSVPQPEAEPTVQ